MKDQDMIPVFVPKEIGMRAIYHFASEQDCKLVVSNSGALVLEPRRPIQSGAVVRFPVVSAGAEVA